MSELGRRVKEVRLELGLNQGDTAILFGMKQPDYAKVESGTTKNKFVDQLANFILKKNISPEKLYYMVTGRHYKEEKEPVISELPNKYIVQTNKLIDTMQEKIDELREERDFLKSIMKDIVKLKEGSVSNNTPGNTQRDMENHRQTGAGIVGKKLKRPETADP
jgi:transcriptional regulator with XRE-family HTH domain